VTEKISKRDMREQRFVPEYLLDLNGTRPAIAVGYSPKTAAQAASRMRRPREIGLAAALVLLSVAGAIFWAARRSNRVEPLALEPVPFTTYQGHEDCPTFSPDGSQIAFAWDGNPETGSKGYDLYVKAIGSETLLRLTHHPSEWISPAWSPDGTQIAFHRLSGADTGIYVVPALGSPERKLRSTRLPYAVDAPISWSPDGKWSYRS
jgi:dipeptidyl aminopeptidase/acylaminoacyl peptidase